MHTSLFDALLHLITSSTRVLRCELEKAGLPEPWLDRPQLHPWDIDTPSKKYWDARRTLLSSLGTMIALVQNPRERILCEGMGYHHPAVQNFIAHTRIADILSEPDVNEAIGLHVTEIARKTNTHPAKLERILRFLCMYHIFQETSPNVFANNRCSACFKSGSPNADVPFYWSDISFRAATAFSRNLRNPETAFSDRVQDSAFSSVFGSVRPEFDDNENGTGEIGEFEIVGHHLDKLGDSVNSGSMRDHRTECRYCNESETESEPFERVSGYCGVSPVTSSPFREFQNIASHGLSDFQEEEDSSEQFSPLSELAGFHVSSDTCTIVSSTKDFPHLEHDGLCATGDSSVTGGNYSSSNGVIDSGIILPVTTEKGVIKQGDDIEPAQQGNGSSSTDDITQDELDPHIPPATTREEPSSRQITTAFSFLSYPQCGLYRKAFAQGMFTLDIMNGALGYRDINWQQWDKKDNIFVELGASTGHLSLSVMPCLKYARFINQDLPEVCREGIQFFSEKNPEALHSGRVTFQPHDFFTPQPVKGAAVYILSNILHDWPDKEALDILGNIAEVMTANSRLLVCEIVHIPAISQSLKPPTGENVEEAADEESSYETDFSFNEAPWPLLKDYGIVNRYSHHQTIELMILFNGLDRTLSEYCSLFGQRNLELVKIHPIRKLVSVMELKLKNT